MAIYKTVSIKEVIFRIVHRLKPEPTWADDLLVHITDGLDRLSVKARLESCYCVKEVKGNIARMPKDLVSLTGVLHNNRRLRINNGETLTPFLLKAETDPNTYTDFFKTDVTDTAYINQADYSLVRGLDLKQGMTSYGNESYFLKFNAIQTSFKEGVVVFVFKRRLLDEEGFPEIPDIDAVKEALFWYSYAQLILGGFTPRSAGINYDYCWRKFLSNKKEARFEIKQLNGDQLESFAKAWVHLIPPTSYENFFNTSHEGESIDFNGGLL